MDHESLHSGSGLSLKQASWNPYVVGAGIGILSWLAFLVVNKPIGMSTEISKFSGWLMTPFMGWDSVVDNAYWASKTPAFGYSTLFLVFTALGALLSSRLGGTFRIEKNPSTWEKHQGGSVAKRMTAAFLGGAILLYGARMAGGCTSGHGISGTLQLALSGWIFFPIMFGAGIITAKLLFRKSPARS